MKKENHCYLFWGLLFLFCLGLFSSCSKKKEQVLEKKVLNINFLQGDVPSLDPHELTPNSVRGTSLGKWLFEGLIRLSPEEEPLFAGAEKVEISPSKTRYLFTLRDHCYSDGTAVLAKDYEKAWKKALSKDSKCVRANLFYIIKNAEKAKKGEVDIDLVGVKAIGEKQLLVELNHPAPYFLHFLSLPIFAPFKVKEGKVLGSGPYMVKEWKKDDHMDLDANPFFWDRDQLSIEKVTISMVQDGVTVLHMFEQGQIDWIGDPICSIPVDILTASPIPLYKKEVSCPYWIHINTKCASLSSPLIRKALSSVIDRQAIAKHILIGSTALLTPLSQTLSPKVISNNALEEGQELFAKGMKELGFTKESFPPIILSCSSIDKHKKVAEYLQEKWQSAFGIKVYLDIKEWATFFSALQRGAYQIGGFFAMIDYDDPLAYFEQIDCAREALKWENLEYEEMVTQAKKEKDLTLRSQLLAKAEELLQEDMPIIPLVNAIFHSSYSSKLKGVCSDHIGIVDIRWARFDETQTENQPHRCDQ